MMGPPRRRAGFLVDGALPLLAAVGALQAVGAQRIAVTPVPPAVTPTPRPDRCVCGCGVPLLDTGGYRLYATKACRKRARATKEAS